MAKGKSTWKYNKLLTARRNYYDGGGFLGMDWSNPFKGANGTQAKGALLSAAGSAVGNIGGGLIGGGMTSGVGNVLGGLSSVASAIPGPWGAVASAGLGLMSGLTNRMFGSKMNEENIAKVESNINNLNNFQSNASDFDTLSQNWANADVGMTFSDSFIGKDGWFSNKAKNKAADLRRQVEAGNAWVNNTLVNNADNIATTQMQGLLGNYAAFGGPLFAHGGSIHIKPENKGKFTETKKRTGKTTEELTHSSNPLTKKRAIFAQNAKKWHHAFGGELNTQGGDFTNGMIYIDNGGSHETNPLQGVPMGMDEEGTPNFVEEGETIFNDYVFSRRLSVPDAVREKYKLRGTKPMSFADVSKELAKESEERPNDPISMRGLEAMMSDLASAQEEVKETQTVRQYAKGGNLFGAGGRPNTYKGLGKSYNRGWFGDDGKYTQEYLDRVNNMTLDQLQAQFDRQREYYANEVNKDTDRWRSIDNFYKRNPTYNDPNYRVTEDDLAFAKRGAQDYNPGYLHDLALEATAPTPTPEPRTVEAKRYFTYGTTDPIDYFEGRNEKGESWFDLNPGYSFVDRNGTVRDPVDVNGVITTYTDYYLKKAEPEAQETEKGEEWQPGKYASWLRYAPAVGLGIAAITDAAGLTNKPDYGNAEAILEASRGAGTYQPVRFKPIGNYLTYRPFDRDYYINKMNAEAGATRRSLLNTSGGNRATAMAGLLAADNNYLNQIGGLARQAEEYNLAQRAQVEEFNRGTNTTNSQGFLKADIANQKALLDSGGFSLWGTMAAAEMRERARLASEQAKSANLSGFVTALGDIGFEEANREMVDYAFGHELFDAGAERGYSFTKGKRKPEGRSKAKGEKLKKKKGLTI